MSWLSLVLLILETCTNQWLFRIATHHSGVHTDLYHFFLYPGSFPSLCWLVLMSGCCHAWPEHPDIELNAFQELERRFSRVPKSELDVASVGFSSSSTQDQHLPTCISNRGKLQNIEEEPAIFETPLSYCAYPLSLDQHTPEVGAVTTRSLEYLLQDFFPKTWRSRTRCGKSMQIYGNLWKSMEMWQVGTWFLATICWRSVEFPLGEVSWGFAVQKNQWWQSATRRLAMIHTWWSALD